MVNFQMNQFGLTDQPGEVMNPNPSTISVRASSTLSGTLAAGDVIKFSGTEAGDLPVANKITSGDSGHGVVLFNPKKPTYAANDVFEVALSGSIVTMVSGTAINRGAIVSYQPSTGQVSTTTTNYIGYCLDLATTSGQIIRIFVQPKLS